MQNSFGHSSRGNDLTMVDLKIGAGGVLAVAGIGALIFFRDDIVNFFTGLIPNAQKAIDETAESIVPGQPNVPAITQEGFNTQQALVNLCRNSLGLLCFQQQTQPMQQEGI